MSAIANVGVTGLGVIGKPIALRLLNAGFEVAVFDIRAEPVRELAAAGARACASSMEVAACSELVISLVFDNAQTDDVVFGARGIIHALRPGSIFATGSTLGPAPVQRIASALSAQDCATLDMPITGGYLAAADGKLVLMIGGAAATLERARGVFESFAHVILHTGDIGSGQVAKLAHQLVMGLNIVALLEGLALGTAGGVDIAALKQVLGDGLANSRVLQIWSEMGPRWKSMLAPAAPGAPLPNLRKDLHTALEIARMLDVALPVATAASCIADAGCATGHDNPLL